MGWMELMLVGVVALIVVGPKDLPVMFQALGKITAKLRRMAREFSSAMSDAADATGVGDITKDLKGLTNPKNLGLDSLKDAADSFDKWEPGVNQKAMGAETAKLAQKRAADVRAIREKSAAVAQARLDREAVEAADNDLENEGPVAKAEEPAAKTPKAKKPATKKPVVKKPATKKPAAKKPVTKAKAAAKEVAKPASKSVAKKSHNQSRTKTTRQKARD
ncbi:MAG: twin-arginine translocase TatA/TatE family subunit [Paracoccaceae bacterium]|nr:twin-arginine translocase TatA/TatE family subunit [Paracoccaceae bacterium]